MEISVVHEGQLFTFSNENLEVNNQVYPISNGRVNDNNEYIHESFDFSDFYETRKSKNEDDFHYILNLYNSQYKPQQIETTHGFGPIEKYYKLINVEQAS